MSYLGKSATVLDKRLAALLSFLFHGCLRISEALGLKRSDVVVNSDHIELSIRRAKGDQEGKGSTVVIATGLGPCSPGQIVSRYVAVFQDEGLSSEAPFFLSFRGKKN